jgi:Co/Zn/Cd efflux system component
MGGLENPNFESSSIHEEDPNHNHHHHGHSSIDQINNDLSLNNTNSNQNDVSEQHCHTLDDLMADKRRNATVWRKLIIVLVLCILFMIGEIVGGILAHSISIQTDAAHMASDIAGFFFSILAIYVSGKSNNSLFYICLFLEIIYLSKVQQEKCHLAIIEVKY